LPTVFLENPFFLKNGRVLFVCLFEEFACLNMVLIGNSSKQVRNCKSQLYAQKDEDERKNAPEPLMLNKYPDWCGLFYAIGRNGLSWENPISKGLVGIEAAGHMGDYDEVIHVLSREQRLVVFDARGGASFTLKVKAATLKVRAYSFVLNGSPFVRDACATIVPEGWCLKGRDLKGSWHVIHKIKVNEFDMPRSLAPGREHRIGRESAISFDVESQMIEFDTFTLKFEDERFPGRYLFTVSGFELYGDVRFLEDDDQESDQKLDCHDDTEKDITTCFYVFTPKLLSWTCVSDLDDVIELNVTLNDFLAGRPGFCFIPPYVYDFSARTRVSVIDGEETSIRWRDVKGDHEMFSQPKILTGTPGERTGSLRNDEARDKAKARALSLGYKPKLKDGMVKHILLDAIRRCVRTGYSVLDMATGTIDAQTYATKSLYQIFVLHTSAAELKKEVTRLLASVELPLIPVRANFTRTDMWKRVDETSGLCFLKDRTVDVAIATDTQLRMCRGWSQVTMLIKNMARQLRANGVVVLVAPNYIKALELWSRSTGKTFRSGVLRVEFPGTYEKGSQPTEIRLRSQLCGIKEEMVDVFRTKKRWADVGKSLGIELQVYEPLRDVYRRVGKLGMAGANFRLFKGVADYLDLFVVIMYRKIGSGRSRLKSRPKPMSLDSLGERWYRDIFPTKNDVPEQRFKF